MVLHNYTHAMPVLSPSSLSAPRYMGQSTHEKQYMSSQKSRGEMDAWCCGIRIYNEKMIDYRIEKLRKNELNQKVKDHYQF